MSVSIYIFLNSIKGCKLHRLQKVRQFGSEILKRVIFSHRQLSVHDFKETINVTSSSKGGARADKTDVFFY